MRPDPDALLERIQSEEAKLKRGRLKIFFGANAGVGKTFAMLAAARIKKQEGVDVVVGLVETHGRADTAEMMNGMECLPLNQISYKNNTLREFDLDGALVRKPQLILVDELAHSNVPGSRHLKRWQDIEELLDEQIDVYTTVNVQHLESLNDIVGQITGIRVWETVPDHVFDQADEVTLVDLSPDELLVRLNSGKVYVPQQAEQAARHFFRKGNLMALRELALRRTADRVDADMRSYRADQSINGVWQARERLLVCIGPGTGGAKLVRSAARLASNLKADWLAVYVETPDLQRLSSERREEIFKVLRLAQDLGAETSTLSGAELTSSLVDYARSRNVNKLVVGRSVRSPWRRWWAPGVAETIANHSIDMDVYIVGHEKIDQPDTRRPVPREIIEAPSERNPSLNYLLASGVCLLVTALTSGLLKFFDPANVVMVYIAAVLFITVKLGRGPGILASFFSVAAFDFFFVEPYLSFSIRDTQYLFTFFIMLALTLAASSLTANLSHQARISRYRETRAAALYALSKELSAGLMISNIIETANAHVNGLFPGKLAYLLPDSDDKIRQPISDTQPAGWLEDPDLGIAQWVYDHQEPAGLLTQTLPATPAIYLPLKAPLRTRGVLALRPDHPSQLSQPEQYQLLETCAAQIALALERVHFFEVARDALVNMESERLRNSILSAISHDLRTPLTVIVSLASTLHTGTHLSDQERTHLTESIHEEALRMISLVVNLLDMARLQAGGLRLNKQWEPIEEVVGTSLRATARVLGRRKVTTQIPQNLPLVAFDAVLIERVLCNLLENAAKYTPAGSCIIIGAELEDGSLVVSVSDNGPGLPPGMEQRIFDMFARGEKESATPGVGLGLAICRAIIEAHGGKITACNIVGGGAKFSFTLPADEPPPISE